MALLLLILFIEVAVVVPLAGYGGQLKRVLFIAFWLELAKYFFVILFADWLLSNEHSISILFLLLLSLPERLAESDAGAGVNWYRAAMFVFGMLFNLAPAYLVTLYLPVKESKRAEHKVG